jgi:type IV secretion system protein VirB8
MLNKLKNLFHKKQNKLDDFDILGEENEELNNENSEDLDFKIKIDKSNVFEKTNEKEVSGFDWFSDRYQILIAQRNTMIFLLIFSILTISILGIIIFFLFKNKSIEPFIIEVDKKTGLVTFLKKDNKIKLYTEDIIVRNYFIKKYLDARETLDTKNFNYFYDKVVPAFSAPQVLRQFKYLLRSNEKSNPLIAYDNNIECNISINSMNEIGNGAIQIRFTVNAIFEDGKKKRINKIATLNYEFINYEMEEETRYINPLGFLITNYRVVDENF